MNIFVGNLAPSVTSDDLRTAFAGYGTVINAIVMKDTVTDKSLGYGHVYLVPEQAARAAMHALDHLVLRGRPLIVRECVYRAKRDRRIKKLRTNGQDRRQNFDRRRHRHPIEQHMLPPKPPAPLRQTQQR